MTWTSKICKRFLYLYALIKLETVVQVNWRFVFFLKEGVFLPFTSMILCKGQCQLSNKHLFSQEQNWAAQREKHKLWWLRWACTSEQSCQSLRCLPTQNRDKAERKHQSEGNMSGPTEWLGMGHLKVTDYKMLTSPFLWQAVSAKRFCNIPLNKSSPADMDCIWAKSWENLFLPYANNKGADQPAHLFIELLQKTRFFSIAFRLHSTIKFP